MQRRRILKILHLCFCLGKERNPGNPDSGHWPSTTAQWSLRELPGQLICSTCICYFEEPGHPGSVSCIHKFHCFCLSLEWLNVPLKENHLLICATVCFLRFRKLTLCDVQGQNEWSFIEWVKQLRVRSSISWRLHWYSRSAVEWRHLLRPLLNQ